jgi:carbonic anhydrase
MKTHNKETQATMTPEKAIQFLKEGNQRFVNNLKANRDLLQQVNETREGQWPFAAILSCSDSRTSSELVFDQGLGDIFSVRLAGNIATDYAIASLEFAVKYLGVKAILVVGHSSCGAVKGACDKLDDGMLHNIFDLINPAIDRETTIEGADNRNAKNADFVTKVTNLNVQVQIDRIKKESATITEFLEAGKIKIEGAVYEIATGEVAFL